MAGAGNVIEVVKRYILEEFLQGEDPANLTSTTPLLTGGIIDSVSTLKLVMFLEKEFGIVIEPFEADEENLDTLEAILALVESKT